MQHEDRVVSHPSYPRYFEPRDDIWRLRGEGKTIEADVTYVGRKAFTNLNVAAASHESRLALIERDGTARSVHMPDVTAHNIGVALDNLRRLKAFL